MPDQFGRTEFELQVEHGYIPTPQPRPIGVPLYILEAWVYGKGEKTRDKQAVKVHIMLNHEPNPNEISKAKADAEATYRRWYNEWSKGSGHQVTETPGSIKRREEAGAAT